MASRGRQFSELIRKCPKEGCPQRRQERQRRIEELSFEVWGDLKQSADDLY
jgi:hypothetical protein